jgi:exodeoxyribonuclease VII large subunit
MPNELKLPQRDVFTVSRLVRETRAVLEGSFPMLWLEGEISNYSRPSSGHMYFSLKDEAAQVRCAMFRTRNMQLRFTPGNGMHVMVRARVTMYEPRGEFQIVVEQMEEAGLGVLQRAFEALKNRLGQEGLFDAAHKRPLPTTPQHLGVITSATGAAIRDILSVLKRRYPVLPVMIYPVAVQGEGAGREIAEAIKLANQRNECDVLIVGRGGGSLEDLWAFNEEVVARAIYNSEIPIISAVGHEIDFTIADFVADLRAPTPSAAAELVTPDMGELQQQLMRQRQRLLSLIRATLQQSQQQLVWLSRRLQQQHPGQQLQHKAQRLDELELRLMQNINVQLRHQDHRLQQLTTRLHHNSPSYRLQQLHTRYEHLQQRLHRALRLALAQKQQQLAATSRALNNISPLATLERGYAIVQQLPEQHVVRDAATVKAGDKIQARLSRGVLVCTVDEVINPVSK